jgi:hypothetical protein
MTVIDEFIRAKGCTDWGRGKDMTLDAHAATSFA